MSENPTLGQIRAVAEKLQGKTRVTPVIELPLRELEPQWPSEATASFKLELMQITGTFKARGALNVMLGFTPEQRAKGVTAVSAGNHAVAVAYAAKALGMSARVVMIKTANPVRVALARSYGAEIEFAEDGKTAFERVREIETQEGRCFVHPFEGPGTALGTATVGLEWCGQAAPLDAVVVACGGGGLLAGVATAFKLLSPSTRVYGVEPEGADSMNRSFETGGTVTLPGIKTIADSLGAPMSAPYSFGLCRQYVDRMVRVSDTQIRAGMRLMFSGLKLVAEPAAAAALAGVLGPLREELAGMQRIGILVCGSNIDAAAYCQHLAG